MKSKQQKREEAALRDEASKKLSKQQRIENLDKRFGKDLGASKERNKLLNS